MESPPEIPLLSAKFQPDTVSASPRCRHSTWPPTFSPTPCITMALLQGLARPSRLVPGPHQHGSLPLLSQIDPQPIAHVGNFLVFRWPAVRESRWWRQLRRPGPAGREPARKSGTDAHRRGRRGGPRRFNSAEKLDLSRFWNWQDSPIPDPFEIAPLEAGLRQATQAPAVNPLGTAQLQQSAPLGMPELSVAVGKLAEIAGGTASAT